MAAYTQVARPHPTALDCESPEVRVASWAKFTAEQLKSKRCRALCSVIMCAALLAAVGACGRLGSPVPQARSTEIISALSTSGSLKKGTFCENWRDIVLMRFFSASPSACEAACRSTPGCHSHGYFHQECVSDSNCVLLADGCKEITRDCSDLTHYDGVTDSFTLKAVNVGCKNTEQIQLGPRTITGNKYQCATKCLGLRACKQFAYLPVRANASDAGACYLLSGECKEGESDMWELYVDKSEKADNNATFTGFGSHRTMPGATDDDWFDPTERMGCRTQGFECRVAGVSSLISGGAPPHEHWKRIWESAVTAHGAPGESCQQDGFVPRLFAGAPLGQGGLGSRLNNLANEMLWAMWTGLPVSVCTPPAVHNVWQQYFENPGFHSCDNCGNSHGTSASCAGAYASRALDEKTLVHMKRFLYSKLFKFKADILERQAAWRKALGLETIPYVGVHLRRGDKVEELYDQEYFPTIQNFAEEIRRQCSMVSTLNHNCTVFVASDSPDAKAQLRSELRDMQVLSQQDLPPDHYSVRNAQGEDDNLKSAAEVSLMIDWSMLINSDVFICTASSNVGRFAFFMRPESRPSVSLDDGGSFFARNC